MINIYIYVHTAADREQRGHEICNRLCRDRVAWWHGCWKTANPDDTNVYCMNWMIVQYSFCAPSQGVNLSKRSLRDSEYVCVPHRSGIHRGKRSSFPRARGSYHWTIMLQDLFHSDLVFFSFFVWWQFNKPETQTYAQYRENVRQYCGAIHSTHIDN